MSYETIDFETVPFSKSEVNAEMNRILKREPRINPKHAQESAIRGLQQKYDMLSDGGGRVES